MTTTESDVPVEQGKVHTAEGSHTLSADKPLTLTGKIKAVAAGAAEIRATATAAGIDIVSGSQFLTVDAEESTSGIAVPAVGAVAATDEPVTLSNLQWAHKPVGTRTADTTAGKKQACATGSWNYIEHTGYTRVSANAGVRVFDADTDGPDELLASGVTDEAGRFTLCFDNRDAGDRTQDVYVQFSTENEQWKIQSKKTRQAYHFATATKTNVKTGTIADFGSRQPAAPELMRGIQAYDSLNSAWNFVPGTCWDARDTDCRQGVINWEPDSTSCCWYELDKNEAFLAAATPDTAIATLHEFGHALMDDIYEDAFPSSPNCSPHYITRKSSAGCAWTEGWPTFFAGTVLGDPVFRWPEQYASVRAVQKAVEYATSLLQPRPRRDRRGRTRAEGHVEHPQRRLRRLGRHLDGHALDAVR
ncbi:hypothetical protein [Streptomyces sp. SYSU K217416]